MRQTDGHIGEGLQSGNGLRTLRSRRLLPCLYEDLPPNLKLHETIINKRNHFAFSLPTLKTLSLGQTECC